MSISGGFRRYSQERYGWETGMEGKLRVLAYVAVLGSMALHGQQAVAEHPFSTDVYPTGVYPDDVSNVQAAVSA